MFSKQCGLVYQLKLYIRIQEVVGSNLGRDMGYGDFIFFVIFLSFPRTMTGQRLD
jgi:hypothetical protein